MLPGAAYVTCTADKAARNHVDKAGIIKQTELYLVTVVYGMGKRTSNAWLTAMNA
jgi:hypothetical protein